MRQILINYGAYSGYQLSEIPQDELETVAARFPLSVDNCPGSDWEDLVIVIAIHEELKRRERGGKPSKKLPSLRELADEIVTRGFRELSKTYHPDRSGDNDIQVRLADARNRLAALAETIEPNYTDEDVISIPAPPAPAVKCTAEPPSGYPFTDDDVPF